MNYQLIYDRLIDKYGTWKKPVGIYTERHRKNPGCFGGRYVKGNAFYVPARVHLLAHLILVKLYPGAAGIIYSAQRMACYGKTSTKRYEWLRVMFSNFMKANNPMKNIEVVNKMSTTRKKLFVDNPQLSEALRGENSITKREDLRKIMSNSASIRFSRPEEKEKASMRTKQFFEANPEARYRCAKASAERWTKDNPMKNPETVEKARQTRKLNKEKKNAENN